MPLFPFIVVVGSGDVSSLLLPARVVAARWGVGGWWQHRESLSCAEVNSVPSISMKGSIQFQFSNQCSKVGT